MFMTFDSDYTILVGPNCTSCYYNYKLKTSFEKGFLEITNQNIEIKEISSIVKNKNRVYIHGKWGLESIALSSSLNKFTYGNITKHKVFIVEKIEEEIGI